eukprot:tig00020629_g12342.t1
MTVRNLAYSSRLTLFPVDIKDTQLDEVPAANNVNDEADYFDDVCEQVEAAELEAELEAAADALDLYMSAAADSLAADDAELAFM